MGMCACAYSHKLRALECVCSQSLEVGFRSPGLGVTGDCNLCTWMLRNELGFSARVERAVKCQAALQSHVFANVNKVSLNIYNHA